MKAIDLVKNYIIETKEDFTVNSVKIETEQSFRSVHIAKTELLDSRKIYHVGYQYSDKSFGVSRVYNTRHRPLECIPLGVPSSLAAQIVSYLLWIDGDFTIQDVAGILNTSERKVYYAKKLLIDYGINVYVVKKLRCGHAIFNVMSKTYREYEGTTVMEEVEKKPKIKKESKKIRPVFHPVDPLAGFAMPR